MKLEKIVNSLGFQTVLEYRVGDYLLDIFLPELNLGVEYDGKGWHWKNRDRKRDEKIFEIEGIKILRISNLKETKLKGKIENFIYGGGKCGI